MEYGGTAQKSASTCWAMARLLTGCWYVDHVWQRSGDLTKYVPLAPARFVNIEYDGSDYTLSLVGGPGKWRCMGDEMVRLDACVSWCRHALMGSFMMGVVILCT